MIDVSIRRATQLDGRFIADSWLRSFQNAYRVKKIPAELYWRFHRDYIADLIRLSDVIVACDPEDPWTIHGYIVGCEQGEGTILCHFVYVKDQDRKRGIGTLLMQELCRYHPIRHLVWTHDTKQTAPYLKGLRAAGVVTEDTICMYNPYLGDKM